MVVIIRVNSEVLTSKLSKLLFILLSRVPLDVGFSQPTVRSRCLRSLVGPCRESSPIKPGIKPSPFTRIAQTGLGMKLGFSENRDSGSY